MQNPPVVVVLAAGRSSRLSGPRLWRGETPDQAASVLGQTISRAIASGLPMVVVTTELLAGEAARWAAGRDVVLLPEAGSDGIEPLGMGSSIATGVAARPHAGGWLVLPGDMSLVLPSSLLAVAEGLAHHAVVFAQHRGRRGHPVGFSAELFSDLVKLSGDDGARRVVARYPSAALELDDPGVLLDADTPADLPGMRAVVGLPALRP